MAQALILHLKTLGPGVDKDMKCRGNEDVRSELCPLLPTAPASHKERRASREWPASGPAPELWATLVTRP